MSSFSKERGLRPSPTGVSYDSRRLDIFSAVLEMAKESIEGKDSYYDRIRQVTMLARLRRIVRDFARAFDDYERLSK